MMPFSQFYDISLLLGLESITYPGDPPFSRELLSSLKNGDVSDISALSMSAHAGTHLDAPSHFIPDDDQSIDRYPVRNFILPAYVTAIEDKEAVQADELKDLPINPGDALLFQTENSRQGRCTSGKFSKNFIYVSTAAADVCVSKKLRMVGIDYISVDKYNDATYPVHHKLLGNGIFILESVNLANVPPGRYTLICLPLKIRGGEASPVRAVLMR